MTVMPTALQLSQVCLCILFPSGSKLSESHCNPRCTDVKDNIPCEGYEYTNSIQVTINNVTGDLLANVTDSAIQAGGNDVTLGGISVSHLMGLRCSVCKHGQTPGVLAR